MHGEGNRIEAPTSGCLLSNGTYQVQSEVWDVLIRSKTVGKQAYNLKSLGQ